MAEYDNSNTAVLFKNDKGNNPKRPDYRGSGNWQGEEFNISGWVKESRRDGSKFLSLRFEKKGEMPQRQKPTQPAADFDDDKDIPF